MISSREQAQDVPSWQPSRPKFRPLHLLVAWLVSAAALLVAAWIVPGAAVNGFLGALAAALAIAVLNAIVPPLLAALRLPNKALTGLLLLLLCELLRPPQPVRIQDVRAVDRCDRRGRRDGAAVQEPRRLGEQEAPDERDGEDPEDEFGGAPHDLEHEQDSFCDWEKREGRESEKLPGESG